MQHFQRMLDHLVDDGVLVKKDGWYRVATANEQAAAAPAPSRKGKAARLPSQWAPDESLRAWAMAQPGMSAGLLDAYVSYFTDYAVSNNKTYADWDAAFRNCVRSDWGGVRKNFKATGAAPASSKAINW
jgi:hypothetical protein